MSLLRVERGYDPENLLTFHYDIPRTRAAARTTDAFHAEFLERLASDGRVSSTAFGCGVPMAGHCFSTLVHQVEGQPPYPESARPVLFIETVSEDYFRTLGTPLIAGRPFEVRDRSAPQVVILNRSAARALFGDADPLGRTVISSFGLGGDNSSTVIGLVDDILYDRPEQGMSAVAYVPLVDLGSVTAFVRTVVEPSLLLPFIQSQLKEMDPGVVPYSFETAVQIADRATADSRILLILLSAFAGLAVLLAVTGIWSIVAYAVSERTRELGLRMALGARARQVVLPMLRHGALAAAIGLLIGIPASLAASRLLASLLFGVRPTDARVYTLAVATLAATALLASWLPARRATRVDPMQAMRVE
jgi:putative ABC transport system permease protein